MSDPVIASTNVRPNSTGPNSRLRMGEFVLAVIRVEGTQLDNSSSNNQEVPSVTN